jgi:hypothetical protein
MKYVIAIVMLIVLVEPSIGQVEPKLNEERVLKGLGIKSLSTFYYDNEDTTKSTKRLLFRKEYDNKGNLIFKYLLSLWDVVSYDHTTTFSYDRNNNLTEKIVIQKILNLGKRDEDFIKDMGDDPINEKFTYYYNDNNQLVKMEGFSFGKEGFNGNQNPDNTVTYEYERGLLVKEVSTTPNGMVIYQNYIATFDYNDSKQKIQETKIFTTSPNKPETTITWLYNDKGLMIEQIVNDKAVPFNNMRIKYEYDDRGRIGRELQFSIQNNKWENRKVYKYDKAGNEIFGDEETTFDYYKNGLVKSELWKSKDSGETVNFITIYRFR